MNILNSMNSYLFSYENKSAQNIFLGKLDFSKTSTESFSFEVSKIDFTLQSTIETVSKNIELPKKCARFNRL